MLPLQGQAARLLAIAVGTLAVSGTASAQFNHPRQNFNRNQPRVMVQPQINTLPIQGNIAPFVNLNNNPIQAYQAFGPAFVNPAFVNPAFVNPAFVNPAFVNPAFVNPAFVNPVGFVPAYSTPPMAFQQPGIFIDRAPDLRVNPWSGAVYKPYSGVVIQPDGTTFYRVPGTGQPDATGGYMNGTGLYFNPNTNTYFNPNSNVVSRPGMRGFLPWQP